MYNQNCKMQPAVFHEAPISHQGIIQQQEAMANNLFGINNWINNESRALIQQIYNQDQVIKTLNRDILVLKARLRKDTKAQVHFLIKNNYRKNLTYTIQANDEIRSTAPFANWCIENVKIVHFDPLYQSEDFIFINFNEGLPIAIPINSLKPNNIVRECQKAGHPFLIKKANSVIGSLLCNYIATEYLDDSLEIVELPFKTGWRNYGDKMLYSVNLNTCNTYNAFGLCSPYLQRNLKLQENVDESYCLYYTLNFFKNFFICEKTRVLTLSFVLYSILYSLFKQDCLQEINKLIILSNGGSASNHLTSIVARIFFDIFDEGSYISLSNGKKEIERKLAVAKDEVVIINCSTSGKIYPSEQKLAILKNFFVYENSISFNNIRQTAESLCVCFGGELEYILNGDEFLSVIIDDTTVQKSALTDAETQKRMWSKFIFVFMKFVEKNQSILKVSPVEVPISIPEERINCYILLHKVCHIVHKFCEAYGVDFGEIGVNFGKIPDLLTEFLCEEAADEKCIIMQCINAIEALIDRKVLTLKDNNIFEENENIKNIYHIKDELWIRHSVFQNIIVPEMGTNLKSKQILYYLKKNDIIIHNKDSNESKRPVKNYFKNQISVIVLKDYILNFQNSGNTTENNSDKKSLSSIWGANPYND